MDEIVNLPAPNQATFLARFSPFDVKKAIVEQNYEPAMKAITQAITGYDVKCPMCDTRVAQRSEPWAVKAWMEAAGAIGATTNVMVVLNQRLGVRDEDELQGLVSTGRQMRQLEESGVPMEELGEEALESLLLVCREIPEFRKRALQRLGSYAVEQNGDKP